MAIRSLVETVACQHIMNRRQILPDQEVLRRAYQDAEALVASLHTFRKTLLTEGNQVREAQEDYSLDSERDI